MSLPEDPHAAIARQFIAAIPHSRELGMELEAIGGGVAVISMPYDERFVGDARTGVIHGGAVSALMDTCCGAAVISHDTTPGVTATLDLRIDYMRPATPGQRITARATCYHVTRTVAFVRADAQTHRFDPMQFDLIYSRFGVTFFSDPPAAFSNLRSSLKPGGHLAFVCWQELAKNPWMHEPLLAASRHIELPAPREPGAPGPFAFEDADRVRAILEGTGFEQSSLESVERPLWIGGGGSLGAAVTFLLEVGPAAAALREAGHEKRKDVAAAVREVIRDRATPSGVVMDAAVWIVTAQNPG